MVSAQAPRQLSQSRIKTLPFTATRIPTWWRPWILLTKCPCITAIKSANKRKIPSPRHVGSRVNASYAVPTFIAAAIGCSAQLGPLIIRALHSEAEAFLKPPGSSQLPPSHQLQPLGDSELTFPGPLDVLETWWQKILAYLELGYILILPQLARRQFLSPALWFSDLADGWCQE